MPDNFGLIIGLMVTAIGALTTAITALWKKSESAAKETHDKLDKCEEERELLAIKIAILETRVEKVEEANGQTPK